MKFFTPEMFIRLQASDPDAADQADEAWESALSHYRRRLDRIHLILPRAIRHLASDLRLQFREVNIFEAVGLLPSVPEIQRSTAMQSA